MSRNSCFSLGAALGLMIVAACDSSRVTEPRRNGPSARVVSSTIAQQVRDLAASRGITPLAPPPRIREPLVRLGQALAFDKVLSGNHDIACMTCHVPAYATGDTRSISIGQGGVGLGPDRVPPDGVFIPRNSPSLFNLGALKHLFWDGRVQLDQYGAVQTPAGAQVTTQMQNVLEFGPISAQPMFPVTSHAEMRGNSGNELAPIADNDFTGIWAGLMKRLGAIPRYREMFEAAYPGKRFDKMNFAYASNAIGAFFVDQLTFANTPWDRFLRGDDRALSPKQLDGARTFLTLKCSICHNGPTLSDDAFHDVAVAQIGPGEGDGASGHDDFGRMRVTSDPHDQYLFRTSPLRNVELTGPYGHDGSIKSLRDFIAHYSQSDLKLLAYDPSQLESMLQGTLVPNATAILAQRDPLLAGVVLPDSLVDKLMNYMSALTDDAARDLSRIVPRNVPSGLPVDRP